LYDTPPGTVERIRDRLDPVGAFYRKEAADKQRAKQDKFERAQLKLQQKQQLKQTNTKFNFFVCCTSSNVNDDPTDVCIPSQTISIQPIATPLTESTTK
jgi:hypothetical protein